MGLDTRWGLYGARALVLCGLLCGSLFAVVKESFAQAVEAEPVVDAPLPVSQQRSMDGPALNGMVPGGQSRGGPDRAAEHLFGAESAVRAVPPADLATAAEPAERFHWKGLLWQSLAFQALEHGPRIASADAGDRHLLLNKPFWSDYWASLGHYEMRQWNDGDSIKVNYLGHPMQGAISGYIEVQNNPRDREVRFENSRRYWESRGRAMLWATAYSTEFEIGPLSEASIFNQGGYTYPLGCKGGDAACERTAKYTNNTGWVDFIVTPVGGTALLVAQDLADRYISDPLMARHPGAVRYKILRGALNPSMSLTNALRWRYPWYRDYDEPLRSRSKSREAVDGGRGESDFGGDVSPFFSSLSLPDNERPCRGCRESASGGGVEAAFRMSPWADAVVNVRSLERPGSLLPLTSTGSVQMAYFGLRSGFVGRHAAVRLSLMPGLASFSQTGSGVAGGSAGPTVARRTGFSALAAVSAEVMPTRRFGVRFTVEQVVMRYKSGERDPAGEGMPPRLSFLSHENYINATNWGVMVGPVVRF